MSDGHESGDDSDLRATATRLGGILLEGLQLRLELFALELAEERKRIAASFLTALIAALAVLMAIFAFNTLILILLWDSHRVEVAVGMAIFYLAVAVACAFYHLRVRARTAPAFAATLEVLARDQQSLRG